MTAPNVLVDSSIWVDHINGDEADLAGLLRRRKVIVHPMVIGEVALGSIRNRGLVLTELSQLPPSPVVSHREVMAMIDWGKLHSCGIGYVDAHLLAAVRLVDGGAIWTRDKRLHAQAERLGLAYS
jgi:predicted nucleic acid-binding protein